MKDRVLRGLALTATLLPLAGRADDVPRAAFPEAGVGVGGASGFERIVSALPAERGVWRAALRGSFFQGSSLVTSGTSRQLGGELSLGWGVADGVELFGAYRNGSTTSEGASPELMLVQGDLVLGARSSLNLGGFAVGGEVRGEVRTGGGSDVPALDGSNVFVRALASRGFDTAAGRLVGHLNLGAALGKSSVAMTLDSAQIFGAGLSGYHRAVAGAGVELHLGPVTPFASFDLEAPLGVASADLTAAGTTAFGAAAKRFALGARVPVAAAGALDVALDLGSGAGVRGFARTAPYALVAGFSYAFDASLYALPTPPPVHVVTTGQLHGTVLDAATGKPLQGAVVSIAGSSDSPVASDVEGAFTSREHAFGAVQLKIERDGFKPGTFDARIAEQEGTPLLVRLDPLPPPPPPPAPPAPPVPPPQGTLLGHLEGTSGSIGGRVHISGPRTIETKFDQHGTFSYRVPPGVYEVEIYPDAHVAKRELVNVMADDVALVLARLEPKAVPSLVTEDGAKLQLSRPLTLDEKSAAVAEADRPLLADIADLLVREPNRKLSIAVHADPGKNAKDDRLAWTIERANALRAALVSLGAPGERVVAQGFGLTQPLVPLKAKDRAKNRRVELSLESATPATPVPSLEELPELP